MDFTINNSITEMKKGKLKNKIKTTVKQNHAK